LDVTAEYPCPACGEPVLVAERPPPGSGGICIHCYWQDDLRAYLNPDTVCEPNAYSLNDMRRHYGPPPLPPSTSGHE
jgi:hypothetical protein